MPLPGAFCAHAHDGRRHAPRAAPGSERHREAPGHAAGLPGERRDLHQRRRRGHARHELNDNEVGFIMSAGRSVDVDDLEDFARAERMLEAR